MPATLIINNTRYKGRKIELSDASRVTIGRDIACPVQIAEKSISRVHCAVEREAGGYRIVDLNSSNGTHVNGERVESAVLDDGDVIRLGNCQCTFYWDRVSEDGSAITYRGDEDSKKKRYLIRSNELNQSGERFRGVLSVFSHADLGNSQILQPETGEQSIEAYRTAHRALKALFRTTEVLGNTESVEAVFEETLNSLDGVLRAERMFVLGYDPAAREIQVRSGFGYSRTGVRRVLKDAQLSRTIVEEALARNAVVLSHNAPQDERFDASKSLAGANIKSVICAPLQWQEECYGLLYLDSRLTVGAFTRQDAELVGTIGRQASQTLHKQVLSADLEELFKSTIRALVAAIEIKDPYTRGHGERVTQFSLDIADVVGLSAEERKTLELTAMLHDVGKIGIPETVLNKKGPLDEREWALIRNHPQMGHEIVKNIKQAENIRPGIRHHHERYDGTGYPDQLTGDAIPLFARIIAVADAFDAMTSDRPYRAKLTDEKALLETESGAGTQFDPELVHIFVRMFRKKYRDRTQKVITRRGLPTS